MANRVYLMPVTGAGTTTDSRRPKYADTDLSGIAWTMMDLGNETTCVVIANVTAGQNTVISAEIDVITVPANLDSQIGAGNLAAVTAALETLHIPSGWVVASQTYRQVLRIIMAM